MMLELLEGDGKDEDCDVLMRILLENRRGYGRLINILVQKSSLRKLRMLAQNIPSSFC